MILWILLAVLLLLILLAVTVRLGVDAGFGEDGPWAKIRVGPALIQLYPGKEKDPEAARKKQEKKARKAAKKEEKQKEPKARKKRDIGGLLEMVWDLLPVVGEAAGKFRRKLRIDTLILKINPVLLGDGIPLFGPVKQKLNLKLLSYFRGLIHIACWSWQDAQEGPRQRAGPREAVS